MTSHSFLGLSPPQSLAAVTTEDGEAVTIHLKRGGSNSPTPTHTVNERFWTHIQFLGNQCNQVMGTGVTWATHKNSPLPKSSSPPL